MAKIESSVLIHADGEQVFSYASDWSRWEDWFEGVRDFKPTGKTESGNGARYLYKAIVMGVSATVETEIHDFVEGVGWLPQTSGIT